jgi:hypothetical protein
MRLANSRREMRDKFQGAMEGSYESIKEDQELEENQNLLKTFLIESNAENVQKRVENESENPIEVKGTKDDGFFTIKVEVDDENRHLYLDKMDERFWAIHSIEKSDVVSNFVDSVVYPRFTKLDYSWLSNSFLEEIGQDESVQLNQFSLRYKDEFRNEMDEEDEDVDKLSMRLWGGRAGSVLSTLRDNPELQNSTSLKRVGIRRDFNGSVLHDRVDYRSKFTSHGETIEGHLYQVREVKNKYYEILENLETDYALKYNQRESGVSLNGKPVTIEFDKQIADVQRFAQKLFSTVQPFRVWSVFNKFRDDYLICSAVDMHTGDKINIELSKNRMRIYLPEDSCGNVILRLFTNIQQRYDSNTVLKGENDGRII